MASDIHIRPGLTVLAIALAISLGNSTVVLAQPYIDPVICKLWGQLTGHTLCDESGCFQPDSATSVDLDSDSSRLIPSVSAQRLGELLKFICCGSGHKGAPWVRILETRLCAFARNDLCLKIEIQFDSQESLFTSLELNYRSFNSDEPGRGYMILPIDRLLCLLAVPGLRYVEVECAGQFGEDDPHTIRAVPVKQSN